jgi:hypothetical protein
MSLKLSRSLILDPERLIGQSHLTVARKYENVDCWMSLEHNSFMPLSSLSIGPRASVLPKRPTVRSFVADVERNADEIADPRSETSATVVRSVSDETDRVFGGPVKLLDWAHTAKNGMTVMIALSSMHGFIFHPFKGYRWGKSDGQRFRLSFTVTTAGVDEPLAVYAGEAMLLWWGEDCAHGCSVRFKLDGGPDGVAGRHPFDGMLTGRKEGQDLLLVAFAIADDETIAPPKPRRRFHELKPVQQSHILCRDERFADWLQRRAFDLFSPDERATLPSPERDARVYAENAVRLWCRIDSRSVFSRDDDVGQAAVARWRDLLAAFEDDQWARVVANNRDPRPDGA